MSPLARALLPALLLLTSACEEVPAGTDPDPFPFNANVDVDVGADQVLFVARVQNATRTPTPDARFAVTIYNGPLFVAAGSAATGALAAGDARTVSVAFSRGLAWSCFQWSVSTSDGRRRSSELIC